RPTGGAPPPPPRRAPRLPRPPVARPPPARASPSSPHVRNSISARGRRERFGLSVISPPVPMSSTSDPVPPRLEVVPAPPPNNLVRRLSTLIGRERETAELVDLLDVARLVTVVGAGGVGKTRLAEQVARERLNAYRDGAWLVDLAPLREAPLVLQVVGRVLGLREEPGRPPLDVLVEALRDRRVLLVLDNCEHLAAAIASLVNALLRACPRLQILATSR